MPITSPGQSIVAARVGVIPAPAAFIASAGRILDTRTTGGKFAPGEERTVALGVPGTVRAAVINLTLTETEGNGGFASVFPNGIPWPGTSSINWFGANQNLANSVTTAVDATGAIKIHVGANRTHVVVDLAGYIL
jgi:hypothetical protein